MITDREQLKQELKVMIIAECQKNMTPEAIPDDATLIGSGSFLTLDSLDALQIALSVKQKYGRRIDGNGKTRLALASVNALADFLLSDTVD